MKNIFEIRTTHCVLNNIDKDDFLVLKEIFDDRQTKQFLPEIYELIETREGILQFILAFEHYYNIGEGILWGIRKDQKLTGFIAVMDMLESPTLFYAMHPNYRLQGYMKECISVIDDYVKKQYNCKYIQTEVYKCNTISIKLLLSAGFEQIETTDEKILFRK